MCDYPTGCSAPHVRDHKAAHLRGVQDSVTLISLCCANDFLCFPRRKCRVSQPGRLSKLTSRCLILVLQLLSAFRTLERRQQVNLDDVIMRQTSPVLVQHLCKHAVLRTALWSQGHPHGPRRLQHRSRPTQCWSHLSLRTNSLP